ncbi:VOC family protein [Streptomyces sp. BE308]|uniref:VOC family protein n=1 Tax=Streptomyces sp. BE308 TaxID=3002529 RepID=UPI002E7A876A|nr:VOC family protein [Streptomyces sp. BE308]MEE1793518.1 VOC family protein [Streptomyces sp. BE308]
MTSRFTELVVDCRDPERPAAFWCAVLDFKVIDRSEGRVEIGSWVPTVEEVRARQMPPTLHFLQVPEAKTIKNRLHLDVSPIDGSTEDEVTRLLALGAITADAGQGSDRNWVVMADPEGNEFDVLRTLAPQQNQGLGEGASGPR